MSYYGEDAALGCAFLAGVVAVLIALLIIVH